MRLKFLEQLELLGGETSLPPLAVAAVVTLSLSGCGGSPRASSSSAEPTVLPGSRQAPHVRVPPGPPPRNLVVKDIVRGRGAAIPPSSKRSEVEIETLYEAVAYESGRPYEERWDPKHPFRLAFGPGLETQGWEKGLVGMKVGGRRELIIPSKLANEGGALVYVIDLVGMRKLPPPRHREPEPKKPRRKGRLKMSKAEISALPPLRIAKRTGPPPKKLVVRDLRRGSGATVRSKDSVLVDFYYVKYREALESSHSGNFGPTKYGLNEVVKAWELGLPGMKVGGRRELIAPGKLVYGKGPVIYLIDLLAVIPGGAGSF